MEIGERLKIGYAGATNGAPGFLWFKERCEWPGVRCFSSRWRRVRLSLSALCGGFALFSFQTGFDSDSNTEGPFAPMEGKVRRGALEATFLAEHGDEVLIFH
jgi:hypothetical protein